MGNAYFDVGYYSKKNEGFEKAREAYRRALEIKPDDAEVRTDFGLTYFLHDPPDMDSAVMEFRKALEVDPRHIKTLQFVTQALVKQNKPGAAEEYLERLKKADPSDASIKELAALIQTPNSSPYRNERSRFYSNCYSYSLCSNGGTISAADNRRNSDVANPYGSVPPFPKEETTNGQLRDRSLPLVNCSKCSCWVAENEAMRVGAGNYFCSRECFEQSANVR